MPQRDSPFLLPDALGAFLGACWPFEVIFWDSPCEPGLPGCGWYLYVLELRSEVCIRADAFTP